MKARKTDAGAATARLLASYRPPPGVADELLDALKCERAIWVGHDWGAPVVWSIAQHHPDICHGVANLCVPYLPNAFTPENAIALADRTLYPEDKFPAAQWDYQLFYREDFAAATAACAMASSTACATTSRRARSCARRP